MLCYQEKEGLSAQRECTHQSYISVISCEILQLVHGYYHAFKNSSVIHEENTKEISTMTMTLYQIKLIDVRKNTNEHRILYKIVILISDWMRKQKQPITGRLILKLFKTLTTRARLRLCGVRAKFSAPLPSGTAGGGEERGRECKWKSLVCLTQKEYMQGYTVFSFFCLPPLQRGILRYAKSLVWNWHALCKTSWLMYMPVNR